MIRIKLGIMKKLILIVTGCALAISPVGAEEKEAPKGPGKGGEAKGGPKGKGDGSFFKQIDKDGDKAISQEEAGERWERMKALDKDADGKVTFQEMAAARGGAGGGPKGPGGEGPGGKGGPGKGGPEMFKRADKNNDGKLTSDEVPEQVWARLSKLDKDGDKAISSEEAKAGRPGGPPPGGGSPGADGKARADEMWKRADQNSDGKISKDEVPEQAWERLGKMDKNGDDAVTREEMAAGMMAMRGGKGDGKGRPGGKGGPPQGGPGAVFGRYDENEDGKLAESEVPAEMWSKLRRADTDADGLVSKDELGKIYSGREGGGPKGAPAKGDTPPETKKKKRPELETPAA
jgi:Ca2+-binding EF-hand superfamily protein